MENIVTSVPVKTTWQEIWWVFVSFTQSAAVWLGGIQDQSPRCGMALCRNTQIQIELQEIQPKYKCTKWQCSRLAGRIWDQSHQCSTALCGKKINTIIYIFSVYSIWIQMHIIVYANTNTKVRSPGESYGLWCNTGFHRNIIKCSATCVLQIGRFDLSVI